MDELEMKGKGKSCSVMNDCPLAYPHFAPVDHKKECEVYAQMVNMPASSSNLGYEMVDGLKNDLDLLSSSVNHRIETLMSESEKLVEWIEQKKEKRSGLRADNIIQAEGRSTRQTAEKPGKLLRDTPSRQTDTPSPAPSKSKAKKAKLQGSSTDSFQSLGRLPKSDAPEKFWAIVEPYCADITSEDMKTLEELLRSHEDDIDYYKIPSLGKHYSHRWALEDMHEEAKDGKMSEKKKSPVKRRLDSTGEASSSSDDVLHNKLENGEEGEESPFGPLTQRLVQALIEENIMAPVDDDSMKEITGTATDPGESIINTTPKVLAKQLNISNTGYLEKRIRKELEEQGILQPDDLMEHEEGDEILAELKQKQQELKAIGQHNLSLTKRLFRLAKEEMTRQDMRRKLAAVDADVTEAYRRVQSARQKKRPPTKREKDTVIKALKEREVLVKQIEASGQ